MWLKPKRNRQASHYGKLCRMRTRIPVLGKSWNCFWNLWNPKNRVPASTRIQIQLAGIPMTEDRKHAILPAATILSARKIIPMLEEDTPNMAQEFWTGHYVRRAIEQAARILRNEPRSVIRPDAKSTRACPANAPRSSGTSSTEGRDFRMGGGTYCGGRTALIDSSGDRGSFPPDRKLAHRTWRAVTAALKARL